MHRNCVTLEVENVASVADVVADVVAARLHTLPKRLWVLASQPYCGYCKQESDLESEGASRHSTLESAKAQVAKTGRRTQRGQSSHRIASRHSHAICCWAT